LIAQGQRLLEQIFPYYVAGNVSEDGKRNWTTLHSLIARELGLKELSQTGWGYWTPANQWISGINPMNKVCETWMIQGFDGGLSADQFIKERLSLVEIGFRVRENEVASANAELPKKLARAEEFMKTRSERKGACGCPVAGQME
jgi:hypothetical protein